MDIHVRSWGMIGNEFKSYYSDSLLGDVVLKLWALQKFFYANPVRRHEAIEEPALEDTSATRFKQHCQESSFSRMRSF